MADETSEHVLYESSGIIHQTINLLGEVVDPLKRYFLFQSAKYLALFVAGLFGYIRSRVVN